MHTSTENSTMPALDEVPNKQPQRPRKKRRWLEFQTPRSLTRAVALGIAIWVIFLGLWDLLVVGGWAVEALLPTPQTVVKTLYRLIAEENFAVDILYSIYRIVVSFAFACIVAVPLGILMGSFRAIEEFVNPLASAWRYLPAPAFIPLLLMWLGVGEQKKLALLFIGVFWFLLTLIMDHTKSVRRALIETAVTLGGNRRQVLWTVVVPAAMPNIVVAMRQMFATGWTYLVIAEIVGASTGIGAMMMRAKRFIHVDEIMAGILVIGILGLLFDFLFRWTYQWLFPYLKISNS